MLLAKSKKNVNAVDNNNRTALWRACAAGHKEVARALLEAGADFLICAKSGTSPKYMAESKGHQAIVDLIDVSGPMTNSRQGDPYRSDQ